MKDNIKELLVVFREGKATEAQVQKIEAYIESGEIDLADFDELTTLQNSYNSITTPEPSGEMTAQFYEHLHSKERKSASQFNIKEWFSSLWAQPVMRLAYSVVLIAVGIVGGLSITQSSEKNEQIKSLASEVVEMKEMMMLTLLEKESTSDRLKAVSLTNEIEDASDAVTQALIKTLNNDENVNVRLSALEALYPYAQNPKVRSGLIQAIAQQDSPLVQVALAEMMVNLQAKGSVEELEKILKKKDTPDEIKERVKESIDILI